LIDRHLRVVGQHKRAVVPLAVGGQVHGLREAAARRAHRRLHDGFPHGTFPHDDRVARLIDRHLGVKGALVGQDDRL